MSARTWWLASYPKSGNTWVRALLTALEQGEAISINALEHGPIASSRQVLGNWLGFPTSDLRDEEIARLRPQADAAFDAQLTAPRFRKIHDGLFTGAHGAPIVPVQATCGAVYVVRDPRDVAVSFAHHTGVEVARAVERMGRAGARQQSSRKSNAPQLPQRLDSWSAHVGGWLDHALFPVLLVRYEDLYADPARELGRIVDFAGLGYSEETIAGAAQAARFERLRDQEQAGAFSERSRSDAPFFRRGRSGAWRDELPGEMAGRIEADHAEMMQRLGYPLEASAQSARPSADSPDGRGRALVGDAPDDQTALQ